MGSLKKLWGWYPTGEKWVKLQVNSNGKVLLSSIQTKARAYLSANQLNITDITWTKILLDTESYDVGSNFDAVTNHRFTAPVTGYYLVSGLVSFAGASVIANKRYIGAIFKNGAVVLQADVHSSVADYICSAFSDIIPLSATDYIELYCYVKTGVNTVDVWGGINGSFLAVHLISI